MSYTTILYAIDIEKLKEAVYGKDATFLRRVLIEQPEAVSWQLDERGPTLGKALDRLVMGSHGQAQQTKLEGYALKLLCEVLGERLPDDDCIGSIESLEVDSPLVALRLPVNIPANDDYPFISFLNQSETRRESERLAGIDLDFPPDSSVAMARHAYAECVAIAVAKGQGVMSFYY